MFLFLLNGLERLFAFTLQIALSILVLYSIRSGKYRYFIYALLAHFITDIVAGLYQAKVITSIFIVEIVLFIMAILSYAYIIKSKNDI
ncbi:YhfC family glutamic-type intramembrane protease [Thermoanaerobacterium sp. RBIITD]|uniref:YhfC family glutamic-type intramembrane protease n=1 Tax=Thermoanaerobacterium sp. RBIITD TaxID=1550240 RepID=UPI000BB87DAD|nr:YhfC family glutamic-type intramembrane protease [Thermoanaerobacterium sp. RBIITD]